MTDGSTGNLTTREVAARWFDALIHGNAEVINECLSPDVEWINYTIIPGYNDDMPWIGTYHGRDAVLKTFEIFLGMVEVKLEECINMAIDGENAACVVHEISVVKSTGMSFEIEFIQWLTIRDGKIIRWKSYTDPSPIIRAIRGKS